VNPPRDDAAPPSDEQLLAEFLAGNEAAFASLVERHHVEIFQFAARFVGAGAAAEDIVQESFLQVYQSAAGFDATRKFRPWLFTIAANKARDALRGRSRRREVSISPAARGGEEGDVSYLDFLADDSPPPGAALEAAEQQRLVREVIERMPPSLREVLLMAYYHRLSYKDIAETLGIPLGTVKSRLHAAVSCFARAYKSIEERHRREPGGRRGST